MNELNRMIVALMLVGALVICPAIADKPDQIPTDGPLNEVLEILAGIQEDVMMMLSLLGAYQVNVNESFAGLEESVSLLHADMDDNFSDVKADLAGIQAGVDALQPGAGPSGVKYFTSVHYLGENGRIETSFYNPGQEAIPFSYDTWRWNITAQEWIRTGGGVVTLAPDDFSNAGAWPGGGFYRVSIEADSEMIACSVWFSDPDENLNVWYLPRDFAVEYV